MKLREALRGGISYLQDCQVADAAIDGWYLLEYLLEQESGAKRDRSWYLLHQEEELTPELDKKYQQLLQQRGARVPLQHITGRQEFMGLTFKVNPDVLVPRQDTELLVEEALKVCRAGMKILDLCTGSGCIIVSLMKYCPGMSGTAADISAAALETAAVNAALNETKVTFISGDLFTNIAERYDMIVSNPPYIPTDELVSLEEEVRCHDPITALDGRADGLYFYREIIANSRKYLQPDGWLMMEIGFDQGETVRALMEQEEYREIAVLKDLAGLDRVVQGKA